LASPSFWGSLLLWPSPSVPAVFLVCCLFSFLFSFSGGAALKRLTGLRKPRGWSRCWRALPRWCRVQGSRGPPFWFLGFCVFIVFSLGCRCCWLLLWWLVLLWLADASCCCCWWLWLWWWWWWSLVPGPCPLVRLTISSKAPGGFLPCCPGRLCVGAQMFYISVNGPLCL